jgi:PmbA protein
MNDSVFTHTQDQLKQLARDVLAFAKEQGASSASVEISEGSGLAVTVRKGQVETIEQNKDKGIGVSVYCGQRRGHANTSDFSSESLRATVEAAYNIARFTAEDPAAGLPDADLLEMNPRDLRLCYPWQISAEEAVQIAQRCEAAAFAVDPRVTNSEGASVYVQQSHFVAANSLGFCAGYPFSRHTLSVAPIAGRGNKMQRDDWYSSARDPKKLADPEKVGRYAAERALARLNARKLDTRTCPVLFEAPLAAGLVGAFVQATSGGALYRKSSFLLDSLGQSIFPAHIQVVEDPHVVGGVGSSPFDEEGGRTPRRKVVSGAQAGHENHRQRGRLAQPGDHVERDENRRRLPGHAAQDGHRPAGHGTDGPGHQLRHRRLLARRIRLLGRERRDPVPGRGDHDRRQHEGHVPVHRRHRQ